MLAPSLVSANANRPHGDNSNQRATACSMMGFAVMRSRSAKRCCPAIAATRKQSWLGLTRRSVRRLERCSSPVLEKNRRSSTLRGSIGGKPRGLKPQTSPMVAVSKTTEDCRFVPLTVATGRMSNDRPEHLARMRIPHGRRFMCAV